MLGEDARVLQGQGAAGGVSHINGCAVPQNILPVCGCDQGAAHPQGIGLRPGRDRSDGYRVHLNHIPGGMHLTGDFPSGEGQALRRGEGTFRQLEAAARRNSDKAHCAAAAAGLKRNGIHVAAVAADRAPVVLIPCVLLLAQRRGAVFAGAQVVVLVRGVDIVRMTAGGDPDFAIILTVCHPAVGFDEHRAPLLRLVFPLHHHVVPEGQITRMPVGDGAGVAAGADGVIIRFDGDIGGSADFQVVAATASPAGDALRATADPRRAIAADGRHIAAGDSGTGLFVCHKH